MSSSAEVANDIEFWRILAQILSSSGMGIAQPIFVVDFLVEVT
jgi:hypothetical protein